MATVSLYLPQALETLVSDSFRTRRLMGRTGVSCFIKIKINENIKENPEYSTKSRKIVLFEITDLVPTLIFRVCVCPMSALVTV